MKIILASSSRYRRALFERLNLKFEVAVPNIDETPRAGETPAAMVSRLARAKALAVAHTIPEALIVGSDQVACCEGKILGKPGTHTAAMAQLKMMRCRSVEFHNALAVHCAQHPFNQTAYVLTQVQFRDLSEQEIDAYLRIERPYDVAGSMKSEGLGIALVESIKSEDPTALMGLPLIALTRLLRAAGVSPFTLRAFP